MKGFPAVFVDSDVVISSLISTNGAAYFLINKTDLIRFISNLSIREMKIVVKRLNLDETSFNDTVNHKLQIIKLLNKSNMVNIDYSIYVTDKFDEHIVAGTVSSGAKFLVTYNLKHYHIDKIKSDLGIIIMTPARFLQYLRSL